MTARAVHVENGLPNLRRGAQLAEDPHTRSIVVLLWLLHSWRLPSLPLFTMSTMRTRRKSKQAAAAAAAAEIDIEQAESVAPSDAPASPSKVDFSVSIPDDLDLEYLSRLLPDVSYESPSQDAILSLYRLIITQAGDLDGALRDLEESRAENERKDVELDQALQDRESSVSSLDVQVKALQEELVRVKQERDTLGESEATLLNGYSSYHLSILSYLFLFFSS